MIGSGKSNIRTVVSIAQSQVEDGPVPAAIEAFASLGAWGAHASNEERDLHAWLKDLHGITLEVYYTTLNIQVRVSKPLSNHRIECFVYGWKISPRFLVFINIHSLHCIRPRLWIPTKWSPCRSHACCLTRCCTRWLVQGQSRCGYPMFFLNFCCTFVMLRDEEGATSSTANN